MERSRRTGTKKQGRQGVLAALRKAREEGNRSSQWEQKEETDVYEQVTEQEYAELVREGGAGAGPAVVAEVPDAMHPLLSKWSRLRARLGRRACCD